MGRETEREMCGERQGVRVCVREEVCWCVCIRERGVPEDADYVLKLQLMGKWISVLDYSVEPGPHTAKSNKP